MSQPRIGRSANPLVVDRARSRKTARPTNAFKEVMQEGASVLLSGARVATRVVGLPVLSAAIAGAQANAGKRARTGSGGIDGVGGSPAGSATDPTAALGKQGMDDDLKLLALQDEIQRRNRQVALVSNVMKARHDTAKAAISNMRS